MVPRRGARGTKYSSHMFAGPSGDMMFRFPALFKLQEISLSRVWGRLDGWSI